jgi:di/tricarboxylate transporter
MELTATLSLPDTHALAILGLVLFGLFVFTRPNIPVESSSLLVLLLLLVGFHFFPYPDGEEAVDPVVFLTGFGNEALITVAALLVVGRALEVTGAVQPITSLVARAWRGPVSLALPITLLVCAVMSAFLSNTLTVLAFLPVLIAASIRERFPASKVLMPAGFAALIGGMTTTIGTSANLLVVNEAEQLGLEPFGLFHFLEPAAVGAAVGLAFLWLVAPRLLPERDAPLKSTAPRIFKAMLFITEDSWACGRTLAELRERTAKRMNVSRVQRGDGLYVAKLPSLKLQPGDRLLVADTREHLKEYERLLGVRMHGLSGDEDLDDDLPGGEQQLAEVVVAPDSPLHSRTLSTTRFRQRYGLIPLGIHRSAPGGSSEVTGDFEDVLLAAGDVILVQGSPQKLQELRATGAILVLDGRVDLPRTSKAPLALACIAGVVVAAAAGVMPISVAAGGAAALVVATGCIGWRDVGSALSAPVVLLIVATLALAQAAVITGADDFVAGLFLHLASPLPAAFTLALVVLCVALAGAVVPNITIAVLSVPIAAAVARGLGTSDEAFVLAVLFGANLSFAAAFGSRPNLVVMSAGDYRTRDFMRVGLPLTVLVWLAISAALAVRYGVPWALPGG